MSTKTVDHHVSAVLRKLGVSDRRAAMRHTTALDLVSGQAEQAQNVANTPR